MNALGVSVEQARRRPVMSRLHACFSIGNFVGALLVVALGWLVADVSPHWALWSSALLVVVLLAALARITPQSRRRADSGEDGGRGPVPPGVWLLAAMAVCFGLTEGTAIDWSSLHVTDVGEVSPSAGAWGLACVSGLHGGDPALRGHGGRADRPRGRGALRRGVRAGRLRAHRVHERPAGDPRRLVPGRARRGAARAADLRAGRAHRRSARPGLRGQLRVRRLPRRPGADRLRRRPHRPAARDAGARRDGRRTDRALGPAARRSGRARSSNRHHPYSGAHAEPPARRREPGHPGRCGATCPPTTSRRCGLR